MKHSITKQLWVWVKCFNCGRDGNQMEYIISINVLSVQWKQKEIVDYEKDIRRN